MMFKDLGDEGEALAGSVGRTDPFKDLVKFAVKLAQAFDRFFVCGGGEGGGGRGRRRGRRQRKKVDEENKVYVMRKRGTRRELGEDKIIGVVIVFVIPVVNVVSLTELKIIDVRIVVLYCFRRCILLMMILIILLYV